jgi:hypothetical protein
VTGLEPVLGYLAAWALRRAGRVTRQLDKRVDDAIDSGLDRLYQVIRRRLGGEPALARFQGEAARGVRDDRTQQRVLLALEDAVERDRQFAAELHRVVGELQRWERRTGVAITSQVTVGGDQHITAGEGAVVNSTIGGSVHTNIRHEHYAAPVFRSTAPGQVLKVFGGALALLAFAGWASIIFRAFGSEGGTGFGPNLPSGIPLAAFYFITFAGGGVIAGVGGTMVTAVKDGRRWHPGHAVVSALAIIATVVAVEYARGTASYGDLLPHFADCGTTATDPQSGGGFRSVTLDQWTCADR